MENHHAINEKTHYKWAIFHSKLLNYQRVCHLPCRRFGAMRGPCPFTQRRLVTNGSPVDHGPFRAPSALRGHGPSRWESMTPMAAMAHMAILGVQELGLLGVLVKQLLWVYTSIFHFFKFSVEARYGWYKCPWFLQMVPEIKSGSIQCQGCFVRFEIWVSGCLVSTSWDDLPSGNLT